VNKYGLSHGIGMRRIHQIHFVGIGGVGMAGIAEVLLREGYAISGSDLSENALTRNLSELGAKVFYGHDESHVVGADVLVISSAVRPDNIEVVAAKKLNIPVVPRAAMLAELMRFRTGIAVSGTHGKTTTTSLMASILAEDGLDPTFVIGGVLNSAGSNAGLGSGRYLVAEADESDASFLRLMPIMSIVTNIDADHMETYHGDFNELVQTFIEFLHRLPFYGLAVCCVDNETVKQLCKQVERPIITYGFSEDALVRVVDYQQQGIKTHFLVPAYDHYDPMKVSLNLPGKHNALNALSTIAVAREIGVSDDVIVSALKKFAGVGRRFQPLGEHIFAQGTASVFDDYGHHPTELAATAQAVRDCWPNRRFVMVFQPHRYTRTRDLFQEFVEVLSKVDVLIVLKEYAAGETLIEGADAQSLCQKIREKGLIDPIFVSDAKELSKVLNRVVKEGDVVFSQGAGSVSRIMREIVG